MGKQSKTAASLTRPDRVDDGVSSSEEASSVSGSASSDPTSTTNYTIKSESTKVSLTHNETKAVRRSKILVYVALMLAAVTIGAATYAIMRHGEQDDFQKGFHNYAKDIEETSHHNADTVFGIIHSLSTALTAFARGEGRAWPNVTLPNFDIRATEAEGLTGVKVLAFAPIVSASNLKGWEAYAWENQGFIADDWSFRDASVDAGEISPQVYYNGPDAVPSEDVRVPLWQSGPVAYNASIVNLDLYRYGTFHNIMNDVLETRQVLMSGVAEINFLLEHIVQNYTDDGHPRNVVIVPVYDDFRDDSNITGFIIAEISWENILKEILPIGTDGIIVEMEGSCGSTFSYILNGPQAEYYGEGLLRDSVDVRSNVTFAFAENSHYKDDDNTLSGSHCEYFINVIGTKQFEQTYYFTSGPAVFASVVVLTFFFTACVFALYDLMVYRRQTKLLNTAERTNAIVSSLFPKDVRDRIMAEAEEQARQDGPKGFRQSAKNQLKGFLSDDDGTEVAGESIFKTKPIADLFPEVSIMFADLVGFTAWSSMREPAQVFTLLETIYHEFDQIAKRRRVFKVETVGDCYVAAAGLPEPRRDHAVVLARFARDCLYKMHILVRQLEITLGPDTADLGLRFGLHSGPVTAGVLRGERARFQLFGDTMNTAARIETTGAKNRIHISKDMSELLTKAGKGHWVRAREDKVHAKGKGELTTFWLEVKGDMAHSRSSAASSESGTEGESDDVHAKLAAAQEAVDTKHDDGARISDGPFIDPNMDDKAVRLVNWNTEIIGKVLKEVIARREATGLEPASDEALSELEKQVLDREHIVLEECVDVIELPVYCSASKKPRSAESINLEPVVVTQLHDYIQTIAAMYRGNPFHNFEHASHVTMSVTKLLSRIVAPDIEVTGKNDNECDKELHDHTYGITSSPMTQFAIILSALIHDVDHTGVPNSQLIQEHASIASVYQNKSIAEQNSIDIAWDLLMQDSFKELRRVIYQTEDEFKRFRQLLVNTVLATDIMDKELSMKRKERWNLAFSESSPSSESDDEIKSRKATIVIEHLIQASDVVHTMQHWHIYRKWNERLFFELYKAYKEGRGAADPSESWFQGEIGFFDFYVIPLAKKLKDCGVFGVSSDEYLNYAQQNRREWESKGQQIVAEMKEKAIRKYGELTYI